MRTCPAIHGLAVRGALAAGLLLVIGCAPAASASWYVDFANGSDSADGRSTATAWQHAPGDAQATGRPASQRLAPGDEVIFRAGVAYRGSIRLADSGSAERPITYRGRGWGEGLAIIDGADPVTGVRACQSAADCGGAADWAKLSRIEFTPPDIGRIVLYGKDAPYWLAQTPAVPDAFFADDRKFFAHVPASELGNLKQGILRAPELAAAARAGGGQMELAIAVQPNLVRRRPLKGVAGDQLRFDAEGLRFYENRPTYVALNGSFAALAAPGFMVQLAPGLLLAHLRPGEDAAALAIGSGRNGFDLGGQSNIVITGFHFRNMTAEAGRLRQGQAVAAVRRDWTNVEVSGNLFGPAFLENRMGIVQISGGDGFRLLANRIENIAYGSGLRATSGKPRNVSVKGNVIRKLGATGITLFGVTNADVVGNILIDLRGIHGNGITAYLGNHNINIADNCVVGSRRPLTFHGDRKSEVVNDIRIRHNILIASADGQAAINSWGANTRGVRIEGNVAIGPKLGILLNQSDENVVVTGNDGGRIAERGPTPASWTVSDNRTDLTLADAGKGVFSETGCRVPGTRIAPVTLWQAAPAAVGQAPPRGQLQ